MRLSLVLSLAVWCSVADVYADRLKLDDIFGLSLDIFTSSVNTNPLIRRVAGLLTDILTGDDDDSDEDSSEEEDNDRNWGNGNSLSENRGEVNGGNVENNKGENGHGTDGRGRNGKGRNETHETKNRTNGHGENGKEFNGNAEKEGRGNVGNNETPNEANGGNGKTNETENGKGGNKNGKNRNGNGKNVERGNGPNETVERGNGENGGNGDGRNGGNGNSHKKRAAANRNGKTERNGQNGGNKNGRERNGNRENAVDGNGGNGFRTSDKNGRKGNGENINGEGRNGENRNDENRNGENRNGENRNGENRNDENRRNGDRNGEVGRGREREGREREGDEEKEGESEESEELDLGLSRGDMRYLIDLLTRASRDRCIGTVASGRRAIGCVANPGCCQYRLAIDALCAGEAVCCYTRDLCEDSPVDPPSQPPTTSPSEDRCLGTTSNSRSAIGCVKRPGCCQYGLYVSSLCDGDAVCCYSRDTCRGWVDYRGYTVSDAGVREHLQKIADLFETRVWLTSGDRNWAGNSLHNVGRAADFWVDGGMSGIELFNKIRKSGVVPDQNYEFIFHGPHTCTGGVHLHIGHYGYNRASCWKLEGTTPARRCNYECV